MVRYMADKTEKYRGVTFLEDSRGTGVFIGGDTYPIKDAMKAEFNKVRWYTRPQKRWYIPYIQDDGKDEDEEYDYDSVTIVVKEIINRTYDTPVTSDVDDEVGKYRTIDELMRSLSEEDATALTTLDMKELNALIEILYIHDRTVKLSDSISSRASDSDRVKILLQTLAEKLCRCIKRVSTEDRSKDEAVAIAICISSIFKRRGIKISSFNCEGDGVLLPKKGSKIVLSKQ